MTLGLLVTFVVALVAGLLITPVIRRAAVTGGLVDEPGGRKAHSGPIPHLGGVAILLAFGLGMGIAVVLNVDLPESWPALVVAVLVLVACGVLDDIRNLSASTKLGVQVATSAVFLLVATDGGSKLVGLPQLPGVVTFVISTLWIVAVINAMNLIDGLDGLAAGVSLAALGSFLLIGLLTANLSPLAVTAACGGAVLGFLRYNFSPASIIMGDAGAMLLGFLLGVVGLLMAGGGPHPVSPWIPAIVLAVPLADTVWAIIRRLLRGQSPFAADSGHIHHRLLRAGLSPRATMLGMTAAGAGFGVLALVLTAIST